MKRFHKTEEPGALCLEFPPSMDMVDRAGEAVRGFLRGRNLDKHVFELGLMSREAICNAVIHGCGLSPARLVRYELRVDKGWATISVVDQGDGWNWRNHDYSLPAEDSVGGRGLFIIRAYSDEMGFNNKGNEITIRKRIA